MPGWELEMVGPNPTESIPTGVLYYPGSFGVGIATLTLMANSMQGVVNIGSHVITSDPGNSIMMDLTTSNFSIEACKNEYSGKCRNYCPIHSQLIYLNSLGTDEHNRRISRTDSSQQFH